MTDSSPYPPSVQELIAQFARLPGIGKRSAERMAYHILISPKKDVMALAYALRDVKKNIRACSRCYNVAEDELCAVCTNPNRAADLICIVELPRDIIAIEKTGSWHGAYHVLQGTLNPADGIGPDELRIQALKDRIRAAEDEDTPVMEIILALNPTTEGDATASFLSGEFADFNVKVSRLARGLASGTDIESTAPSSLQFALEGRRPVSE